MDGEQYTIQSKGLGLEELGPFSSKIVSISLIPDLSLLAAHEAKFRKFREGVE